MSNFRMDPPARTAGFFISNTRILSILILALALLMLSACAPTGSDESADMQDQDDVKSLMSTLKISEIDSLTESGVISGGMLPKVEACITALKGDVRKTHIIDGRISHSLLLEIFTDSGIGTQIIH